MDNIKRCYPIVSTICAVGVYIMLLPSSYSTAGPLRICAGLIVGSVIELEASDEFENRLTQHHVCGDGE